jgi:hypothetical protein
MGVQGVRDKAHHNDAVRHDAVLGDPVLGELIWQHTGKLRRAAHLMAGRLRCPSPTAPYGLLDPLGTRVCTDCRQDGCLDIVHEIYATAQPRLARRDEDLTQDAVRDHARYANITVRREVSEYERRQRVAHRMPAKPTRADGIAATINAELSRLAAVTWEEQWWHALFRMMRAYVCRSDRTSTTWPLDAWAQEKTALEGLEGAGRDGSRREIGSGVCRAEITTDIAAVLAVATRLAGAAWVQTNISYPLIAGGVPHRIDDQLGPIVALDRVEDGGLWRLFEAIYLAGLDRRLGREAAFSVAFRRVFGEPPAGLTPALTQLLYDIEQDRLGRRTLRPV